MATLITMPRYGANMEEGTIGAWMVSEGDTVSQGDVLAEIAIEKLSNELESPADGTVLKLLAEEGDTLDCGSPIAVLGAPGEDYSALLSGGEPAGEPAAEESGPAAAVSSPGAAQPDGNVTVVEMPRYGANMEEGTVASWEVSVGDAVEKGDLLGEIAIEKLSNELESPAAGTVLALLAEEEETLSCGAPIALIGPEGADISFWLGGHAVEKPAEVPSSTPATASVQAPASAEPAGGIAPKALELAEELGVDWKNISGTGRHGMVTREDVRRSLESGKPAAATAAPVVAPAAAASGITPKALDLAEELGIDWTGISGTGRHGLVTREDLRAALAAGTAPKKAGPGTAALTPLADETLKMTSMQKTISKAMFDSLSQSAQTTISMDMQVDEMVAAYRRHKEAYSARGIKLSYTAILIRAVALALRDHKDLRTILEGDALQVRGRINIGVAVDVPGGLVVPNIKDADLKDTGAIAQELADLALRARENRLSMEELTGGTFTITNLGMFGIRYFTPVLNPPESGILGVGTLVETPVVENGGLFVRNIMNMSLTHDHRVVNGAPAARFLNGIRDILSQAEELL